MEEKKESAMNICPHMNGEKCAMEYCDYWDRYRQKCSKAIECKLNVELLAKRVKKNREKDAEEKREQEVKDKMVRRNVVVPSRTVQ